MKKVISIFTLVMINLAAIGSIRSWPTIAKTGFPSIFFFLLAALIFFLPTALVSAELATGWPKIGGIFVWVKEAFGHRMGFLAIWLLWIENVFWYPIILSFIAATVAYAFEPTLGNNKYYIYAASLIFYWLLTWINLKGMKISGWISSIGVILGSFIPMIVIISLGILWYFSGKPLQIDFSWNSFIPDITSPEQWVIFTGVLFSLAGMEMSAIHARDVQNPQRSFPKAMLYTILLVVFPAILGVLAIAGIIPQSQISLTTGNLQTFVAIVGSYNLHGLVPLMALLIFIGAVASLSTWIVGPSRGLLAAAQYGDLPPNLRAINKHGMPKNLLVIQAAIVSVLSFLFVLMPSINSAFWIITVLVAQVYLVMYVLMFAAAIKLRTSHPKVFRSYRIPGGKLGMWLVAGLGILSSIFTFIVGFFPPAQIHTGNTTFYVSFLMVGVILICLAPSLILRFKKPSWSKRHAHETGEDA